MTSDLVPEDDRMITVLPSGLCVQPDASGGALLYYPMGHDCRGEARLSTRDIPALVAALAPPGEVAPDVVTLVERYGSACERYGHVDERDTEADGVRYEAVRDTAKAALLTRLSVAAPTAGGERGPVDGWVLRANGRWYLVAGNYEGRALLVDPTRDPHDIGAGPARWDVSIPELGRRRILRTDEGDPDDVGPTVPTPPATLCLAMLAAEDALAALATAVLAVVRPGKAER